VSLADGTATRALGTVLPGRSERFVIAAPASHEVDILARQAGGGTRYGPFHISLIAGATVPLTIRDGPQDRPASPPAVAPFGRLH